MVVEERIDFDHVEPDYAALGGDALQQRAHLVVEQAIDGGRAGPGSDRGIEPVNVDRDVDVIHRRHGLDDGARALLADHLPREDLRAEFDRVVVVALARAQVADAEMRHVAYEGQLADAAKRAAVGELDAIDVIDPVEVGVEMHDIELPEALERTNERKRHRVIAPQHDRKGLALEDRVHAFGHETHVALDVVVGYVDVAAIDNARGRELALLIVDVPVPRGLPAAPAAVADRILADVARSEAR